MDYITDKATVANALEGAGYHDNKPILVINHDNQMAAYQVYIALSQEPGIKMMAGKGLVVQDIAKRWKKLGSDAILAFIKSNFVLTRVETDTGAQSRLKITTEPHRTFVPILQQGRYCGKQIHDLFEWVTEAKPTNIGRF